MWESEYRTNESAETFESASIKLTEKIRRFRAAEKAHSLGLPLDAFE
jgi:hypothetical protein